MPECILPYLRVRRAQRLKQPSKPSYPHLVTKSVAWTLGWPNIIYTERNHAAIEHVYYV